MKSAASSFGIVVPLKQKYFLKIVIQKRKNYRQRKMLLRCVTMSLSLRKYLHHQIWYAIGIQQIFLQDTMEPRNFCILTAFCTNEVNAQKYPQIYYSKTMTKKKR
jgi:hypothetical protein